LIDGCEGCVAELLVEGATVIANLFFDTINQ